MATRKVYKACAISGLLASTILAGCGSDSGSEPVSAGSTGPESVSPEETCEVEDLNFIVPYDPGGGADALARILAPALAEALPGEPEATVENRAGGAGAVGMNLLAAAGGNDGETLTVGITTPSLPLRWSDGAEGHDYPMDEMPMIGAFPSSTVYYMSTEAANRVGVGSVADLLELDGDAEIKMGHLSLTSAPPIIQDSVSNALGIPFTNVTGYASANDVILATASGEMDGGALGNVGYLSGVKTYVDQGDMMPLFQTGIFNADDEIVRHDSVPDMDTVAELFDLAGVPQEGEDWELIRRMTQFYTLGNAILAAAGTSDGCVEALRSAFETSVTSSSSVADAAERAGADLNTFLTGNDAQVVFDAIGSGESG